MEQINNFERQQNTNAYIRAVTYLDEQTNQKIDDLAKKQTKSRSYILANLISKGLQNDNSPIQ